MGNFLSDTVEHFNLPLIRNALSNVRLDSLVLFSYNYALQEYELHKQNKNNLLSPTSMHLELSTYCPKRCIGCYIPISDRNNPKVMTIEIADSAMKLGKKLGIRNYNLIGGEPLHKNVLPLINNILEKNISVGFYCCSNGEIFSLIDDDLDKVISKSNFSAGLSIDGFKDTNDFIRGKGSYYNTILGSEYLHSKRSFYGAVVTLRNSNAQEVSSPDFVNFISSKGFSYLFYSQSSDIDKQLLDESIKSINSIKRKNIFIYFENFGHLDDLSRKKGTRSIYISKDGNILNHRLERIISSNVNDGVENIVSSNHWKKRFDEQYVLSR